MRLSVYSQVAESIDPIRMARRLDLEPYQWQEVVIEPSTGDLILLCARQSGKSTVVALKVYHTVVYQPGSLVLIIAPSRDQSKELMIKIDELAGLDEYGPDLSTDSVFEKVYSNGSRIVALPGSERSVRGFSGPTLIVIDEASRVPDETYRAARPMMVGNTGDMILLSTPFGMRGFFFEESGRDRWNRVKVVPAFKVSGSTIVPADPDPIRGWETFISPRHDKDFLEEELESLGEFWFRQEYLCEFLEVTTNLFTRELIESALDHDIDPMLSSTPFDSVDEELEPLEI